MSNRLERCNRMVAYWKFLYDCSRSADPSKQKYLNEWQSWEKEYRLELAKLSPTQQLCAVAQIISEEDTE